MSVLRKLERLEARVTRQQKRLIAHAAHLRGTSVTEFVVSSAQEAAAATIRDAEVLRLDASSSEVFVNALLNPPVPNRAARDAARRYKERVGA